MAWLLDNFFELRRFCGDPDSSIQPRLIMDWAELRDKNLPSWEIDAYIGLDHALREGRNAAIMHHSKRDKKLQESKDRHRAGKR